MYRLFFQVLFIAGSTLYAADAVPAQILLSAAYPTAHSGPYVTQEPQWDKLSVHHGPNGWVEWDGRISKAAEYTLQALYASGEKRPCSITMSGDSINAAFANVLAEPTGGFFKKDLRWTKIGSVKVDKDDAAFKFKVSFDTGMPHIKGFRLTAAEVEPFPPLDVFDGAEAEAEKMKSAALLETSAATRKKVNTLIPEAKQVLFVKRATFQSSHYYTDFIDGAVHFGSELCLADLETGSVKNILPDELKGGIIGRCNLSFDGKRVIFDYKANPEAGFRIWEVGIDGTHLKQLTFPPDDEAQRIEKYRLDKNHLGKGGFRTRYHHFTDDMHPCYAANDKDFYFVSTRCEHGVLCDGPDVLTVSVLYRSVDGILEKLSDNSLSESVPSLMSDGRILYTRWEYVDNGSVTNKGLWAVNPDGTSSIEIGGADLAYPSVFNVARQMPGKNNEFVFIGAPHMPLGVGPVLKLNSDINRRSIDSVSYITPEVAQEFQWGWSKPANGQPYTKLYQPVSAKDCTVQRDRSRDGRGDTDSGPLFMDPYPIDEHHFLVSYNPDKRWNAVDGWGIYLISDTGERNLLCKADDGVSAWCPMPVCARTAPPVPHAVRKPNLAEKGLAQLVVVDVYAGLDAVKRGEVKYLRVNEHVPRPWDARRYWDGDEYDQQHSVISNRAALGLRRQIGIVKVETDGSANFAVPADKNIFLQALDENYREIQRERTFVNYRPGEVRSCIGCHETSNSSALFSRSRQPLALMRAMEIPGPQPGETAGRRSISYFDDVQPVLNKHCVSCHSPQSTDAHKSAFDLTETLTERFCKSYESLTNEDKYLVMIRENYPKAGNNHYMPPKTLGSYASPLIQLLDKGHYDVKMPLEDWIKLTTWIDANGQYYGTYYGHKNLKYKDLPDFRPKEDAVKK